MTGTKVNKETPDVKKDSFVYKFCITVCKWFLVSLLTLLCSIFVFTIGTSSCAALAVFREDTAEITGIFPRYFSCFRKFFRKTVPVFLLFIFVILLQVLNLSFYRQFIGEGSALYYTVMMVIIALMIAAAAVLRFYNYEVTFGEPLGIRELFRKSLSRLMRCLPAAGILALLDIGLAATIAGAPVVVPVLLIYPGFHAYLMCILAAWFENRVKS